MQEVVSVWLKTHGESWGKTPSLCSVLHCSGVLSNLCHNAKSFSNVFSSQIRKSDPGSEWRCWVGERDTREEPRFFAFLCPKYFGNHNLIQHPIRVRFENVHKHIHLSSLCFWLGLRVVFGTSAKYFASELSFVYMYKYTSATTVSSWLHRTAFLIHFYKFRGVKTKKKCTNGKTYTQLVSPKGIYEVALGFIHRMWCIWSIKTVLLLYPVESISTHCAYMHMSYSTAKISFISGLYQGQKPSRCLTSYVTHPPPPPGSFFCANIHAGHTMPALFSRIPAWGCHCTLEFLCNNGILSQSTPPSFTLLPAESLRASFFVNTFNKTSQLHRDSLLQAKVNVICCSAVQSQCQL